MWTSSASAMEPDKRIASRGKEPSRLKTHWDYVLEEMAWLAKDFESERKMKISQAKKIAVKVCKSGLSTESKGLRRQKEEEQRIRRLASNIAKDVKKFWTKIEKLILYKHQLEVEGRKKKALDKHLDFLVGQTERYSTMLAEIWLDTPAEESRPPSASGDSRVDKISGVSKSQEIDEALITSNKGHREERLNMKADDHHELAEISVTKTEKIEVIENAVRVNLEHDEKAVPSLSKNGKKDEDAEFLLENTEEAEDDFSTMEADEALITEDERKEELLALERESSLPIEEILKMYSSRREFSDDEVEDDEEGDEDEESELDEGMKEESEENGEEIEKSDGEENDEEPENGDDKHKLEIGEGEEGENDDGEKDSYNLIDAAEAAQSAQPTGFTFSTTKVRTKLPFLLKHSLREYQHIGLDWLVTMYERRLNGILADEMGLGKTIMTIALLAHLACEKGIWGPHLIVVPTSVMLNWETELMKWCPAFKVLTYFGTAKERKVKRQGWSKPNSFHVCITTYRLVIQDAKAFKRKKWKYLILDEAHLIKNWKSQRWQTLLNFNSKRRILLTGTPLQNDLMELWSLMHFLMPHIFQSHQQFRDWFNNPITGMVEGQEQVNKTLVDRLHNVLRPFILRRLKQDVEKQLPGKFEHVIKCRLSKRQRNLYEDFMANSDTQATLSSGNFLGLLNVLMQLRKVCNHPDLFEGRPIISSFDMPGIDLHVSSLVASASSKPGMLDLVKWNLLLTQLEFEMSAWEAVEVKRIAVPACLIEELGNSEDVSTAGQTVTGKSILENIFSEVHEALHEERREAKRQRIAALAWLNAMRSSRTPLYGKEFINQVTVLHHVYDIHKRLANPSQSLEVASSLLEVIPLPSTRCELMMDLLQAFIFAIPAARSLPPVAWCSHPAACNVLSKNDFDQASIDKISSSMGFLRPVLIRSQLFFPDRKLIQFDCGKLQQLAVLLRRLKSEGHRALIFTQMTKMLDVLESFVNLHGYTYLRLDGSTKPEDRQISMQRFNTNPKIFLFILSTRSGGVGVNLVGADTVIFYDSDWNPAMDQQAQDRCHRIGQTREVHIYRLISESTIEENILKKANQKRFLDNLVIQSGSYNTEFFKKLDPSELLSGLKGVKVGQQALSESTSETSGAAQAPGQELSNADVEAALRIAEDEADYMALKKVEQEEAAEHQEFTEEAYSGRMEEDEYADDLDEGKATSEKGLQSSELPSKMEVDDAAHAITSQDIGAIDVDLDEDMDMLADVKQMAAAAAAAGNGGVSFDDQLCPTEKYAMRFLEVWNPIVDKVAVENEVAFQETEWELDRLETLKQAQEAEIDEDNEPLIYESWDTSYADEAYHQQLEALKQQEYEHQLQLEEEMQDIEREDETVVTDTVSSAEFRSKWKKAKFKSLKGGDVVTRDEEAVELEAEAIADIEWQSPVGLFASLPDREISQKKRKHLEEEIISESHKKKMRLDFNGKYEMGEEPEDERSMVALLDYPFLASDRKSSGFSITATHSKNLVKLDKEKKKDTLRSGDKIPPADPWMSAEDAVFCAVVHEYGGNWNLASETLAGLPDGGLYRGRYRNPAHCRERFRQLLFKYTSITSAYPMYEKNGASNIPLKVSEDHISQLLDAVKELPDDEWLLQRHFVAAITSTCLHGGQTTKAYRNSIVKLGNSPHGQSFIRLPKASFFSSADDLDKVSMIGVEPNNTSPSISLVAAALSEQEHKTNNGTGEETDLILATRETPVYIEPLKDSEDDFVIDIEFLETDNSELPKSVQITAPNSSSSSSHYNQDTTLKIFIRRFAKVLSDQRYRLACKMSAEGECKEWAAAAGKGLGVVGDHKFLHGSGKRRVNDSGKATDLKKPGKKKKDKRGDVSKTDIGHLDPTRFNVISEPPRELQCADTVVEKGSTVVNHDNIMMAPEVNDASGDMVGHDSLDHRILGNHSHVGIDTMPQESHITADLQDDRSFTGISGCESMSASYKYVSQDMERALVGDPREVKFRDSEGDDEAMVDHHERLGEESDIPCIIRDDVDDDGNGNDDARHLLSHVSGSLQKTEPQVPPWELESSVRMQPVKVSSPSADGRPMIDNFFPSPLPVPPDLQVSQENDNAIEISTTATI